MKILFLGTGAADYSIQHRALDGYRRNSSILIDGTLLIDPGPCVPDALDCFGVRVDNIKYVLHTHTHSDHYNENTLALLQRHGATHVTLSDGESIVLGGYQITALKGNHSIPVQHFIVDDGKSKLFYGLDSAWLLYEEVQAIEECGGVDLAILDGTVGFGKGDYRIFEHCDMDMIISMSGTLAKNVKRICISHMARTLHTDHNTLSRAMAKHGIEVAYDGLVTEI